MISVYIISGVAFFTATVCGRFAFRLRKLSAPSRTVSMVRAHAG
jgi:hypothetical protein